MTNLIEHEIDLYLLEVFETLFDHEVRTSRRYKHPLSLIHIEICTEPSSEQTQYAAELIAINALDAELRDSDIPCRTGHDFLVLLPVTDEAGARNASERIERALNVSDQTQDGVSFQLTAYIGIASSDEASPATKTQLKQQATRALEFAHSQPRKTAAFSDLE